MFKNLYIFEANLKVNKIKLHYKFILKKNQLTDKTEHV